MNADFNIRWALEKLINRTIDDSPHRLDALRRLRRQFDEDAGEHDLPQTEEEKKLDRLFVFSLSAHEFPFTDDLTLLRRYQQWIRDNFNLDLEA